MPVHPIPGGGYQWGSQKKYYGKDAKRKAARQGAAILAAQRRAARGKKA